MLLPEIGSYPVPQRSYFAAVETVCKCGRCGGNIAPSLLYRLNLLREACGFPLFVDSGFRCPERNRRVGGAPKSFHMRGLACDLDTARLSDLERRVLFSHALILFDGVIFYGLFIHVDIRGEDYVVVTQE